MEPIIHRFMSNLPAQFPVARGDVRICGVVVSIDETTGRAISITRVNELVREKEPAAVAAALTGP